MCLTETLSEIFKNVNYQVDLIVKPFDQFVLLFWFVFFMESYSATLSLVFDS